MSINNEQIINSNEIEYRIKLNFIKYCIVTIIYNKSKNILIQTSRFFNWYDENMVIHTDTIIIEHDDKITKLDLKKK